MTDATGACFLSYRRTRAADAAVLIAAQRDRGIPVWQDIADLGSTLTEEDLRRVLGEPSVASAVMFVTPDVKTSAMIRNVEAPLILRRHLRADGFVAVVVAAGGLEYKDIDSVVGSQVGPAYMPAWNIRKIASDPTSEQDAADISDFVLDHRLIAVTRQLAQGDPLNLVFSSRSPLMKKLGWALAADLTHRFDGRLARAGAWDKHILPGMRSIRSAAQRRAADREVRCSGQLCLPGAVALGAEFLSVAGLRAGWMQDLGTFGGQQELWGLHIAPAATTTLLAESLPAKVDVTALALIVSVTHNIMDDVRSCFDTDFPFRAIVHVHDPLLQSGGRRQLSASEAVQVAHQAIGALREAWAKYKVRGTVHLFLAVPAGLAFMIGQLLNGFGEVQTYEHIPGQKPCYVPAALLRPSI
jgi:hypothetical protein